MWSGGPSALFSKEQEVCDLQTVTFSAICYFQVAAFAITVIYRLLDVAASVMAAGTR